MKIAFLGAGACGLIGAAHCTALGHDVLLYELPEFREMAEKVREAGGVRVDATPGNGLPDGFVPLHMTFDLREAVHGAEMVFVTVPSFGEARVADLCAGVLEENQYVYLTSGYMYGSLEFALTLRRLGHRATVHTAEMNNTIYAGGRLEPTAVRAGGYKHGVSVASFPGKDTAVMVRRLQRLYPEVVAGASVLETGISNPSAALHPVVVLFNASYVGIGEEVLLYHDKKYKAAMSEPVARVYEAMDAERMRLRGQIGFENLKPWHEIFRDWYDYLGAKGETLCEIMSSNRGLQRAKLPPSFNYRYITEDVTAGLLPLVELLERHGLSGDVNRSVIRLACVMSGIDLTARARTLSSLGLAGMSEEELSEFLFEGGNQ